MLCFIENFMKERMLRVAVGNTLFLIAMSEICNGIQEPVKIIGYADD
jgi:hypothetical protein